MSKTIILLLLAVVLIYWGAREWRYAELLRKLESQIRATWTR